ncbi:pectate lyase precursor [Roseiconus nitratireducens]|uniref:Pectate lyase n=1 Tax=Roseiconus nitratireducens TaxID=2605748 RepID=A0A5M6D8Q1_9BACT|nr:pectate lyase precursor [Roseiconus nitratireducens]KAA5542692.1 pectate lyase precursor [Roseiconus nitratireducens]
MNVLGFNRITAAAWLVAIASGSTMAQAAELKAFPGAEGWGAASKGGRGGKVIKVTNLDASGPGSLAEACAADGPRIVVFEVSGVIRGNIRITNPYLTIAGQTAPGAGITVEGVVSSYDHGVHDIIIRHLRIRPRRDIGSGGDCIQLGGLGPKGSGTYNMILDHLSLSWGNDEVIDLYHAHDVTVQFCTIEESDDQGHSKGAHNFGLISAAKDSGAVSVHHNLWAHHARRVPCMAPYREHAANDFCNNLIYNCRGGYADDGHGAAAKSPVNLYQNYYRRGPQTQDRMYPFALSPHMSYYVRDNYFEDWGDQGHPRHWKWGGPDRAPKWVQFNNNGRELDAPAKTPPIELVDAETAFALTLARAGCWPRDRVTKRTVQEVKTKTGAWGRNAPLEPTDEWFLEGLAQNQAPKDTDDDGLPDVWEKAHNLDFNNPADATTVVAAGESKNDRHMGYSHLEYYLNELADNLVAQ